MITAKPNFEVAVDNHLRCNRLIRGQLTGAYPSNQHPVVLTSDKSPATGALQHVYLSHSLQDLRGADLYHRLPEGDGGYHDSEPIEGTRI